MTHSVPTGRDSDLEIMRGRTLGRDNVREIGGTLSNESRFASTHALSTTFFPGWLRGLHDEHEAGTITLIADHMVACERFMLEGKADFLLCHHHTAAQHRLEIGRASGRERVCQYV